MVKRTYPPGPEKKRKRRSQSEYKKSLKEKQKLKNWYGLSERQFKKYVKQTLAEHGRTQDLADEFIKKLEKRLDNVIFCLGLAKSRAQARQIVSHNYFLINGKRVNIPSFELKKGDVITIKENKKKKGIFKDIAALINKKEVPSWLQISKETLEGKIIGEPLIKEVVPPAEVSVIFEFYSR